MESKKDIGRAFRERLDLLQKQPGEAVWDSIRADLNKGKKKAVPVWLRFWLIGGVFLLTAFFTYPLWENKVPHIYIKMPEQEGTKSTGSSDADKNKETQTHDAVVGNESGVGKKIVNPGDSKTTTTTNQSITSLPENGSDDIAAYKNNNRKNNNGKNSNTGTGLNTTISINKATAKRSSRSTEITNVAEKGQTGVSGAVAGNTKNTSLSRQGRANKKNQVIRNADKGIDANNNNKGTTAAQNSEDEQEDSGFIIPASPDYKNYRNNIGNGFVVADIPEEAEQTEKDSVPITDKLKLRTTGVEQVRKAPETKPQEVTDKKFFLYAFAAPMSYSFADNSSYLDSRASLYGTSSKTNFAYGASIGYKATENLSISIGAIISGGEIDSKNVLFENSYVENDIAQTVAPYNFGNIEYNTGVSNDVIRENLATGTDFMSQDLAVANVTTELKFIEVPLELTYTILSIDNFGIALKGILGARILLDNKVTAKNEYGTITLGELKNIDDFSFSAGLGAGLFYKLSPSFQINVEPELKYFSGNKDVIKPTAFMLQAGIQYNFNLFKK